MNRYSRFAEILQDETIINKSKTVAVLLEEFAKKQKLSIKEQLDILLRTLKETFDKTNLDDVESIKTFAFNFHLVKEIAINAGISAEKIINDIKEIL